jgi:N-acylneuraminate cytidylyltransferase
MAAVTGSRPVLAVIPARGGSKGLPGKNVKPLAGLPLIAHSLRCARMTPEISRCIVSTDDPRIAETASQHGGDVPFLRPADLASDTAPMIPVLRHALLAAEAQDGIQYDTLLLLDPTSPGRLPEDVTAAVAMLADDPRAMGVVAVSAPAFNPRWVCVEEQDGYMAMAFPAEGLHTRRQDVPPVYRINATLYLWRRDFLLSPEADRWQAAPHRLLVVPEERAFHIDLAADFRLAELMLQAGIVRLPWLEAPV